MEPLEILEEIKRDLKERFDNDPSIMRVASAIITEFNIRLNNQTNTINEIRTNKTT
tara:strand:- start:1459 stop:1626 length:168 start_codon:yes stop_codon:yes gene_type:complete